MEALCGIAKVTHRNFQEIAIFLLNAYFSRVNISLARESVGVSSPKRNRRKSFGVCGGGQEAKASGRCRSFGSGTARPRWRAPFGARAIGREVKLPVGLLFSRIGVGGPSGSSGPSRGAAGPFGGRRSQARKSPREGGGTRRKEQVRSTGGPFAGDPPRGGYGPSAARPPLHGGVRRARRSEAKSLSSAAELRLPRRQECPARTRIVGSRLRS